MWQDMVIQPDCGEWGGGWRQYGHGCGVSCQECGHHRRHLPFGSDSLRTGADKGGPHLRAGCLWHHRATAESRHPYGPHEDRHPARLDGRTIDFSVMTEQQGEEDFHKFSYLDFQPVRSSSAAVSSPPPIPATHDILRKGLPESPLQRTNQEHRSPLLSQHRDQDCDLCRQGPSPHLHRTRRRDHAGVLHQRILVVAAHAHTD